MQKVVSSAKGSVLKKCLAWQAHQSAAASGEAHQSALTQKVRSTMKAKGEVEPESEGLRDESCRNSKSTLKLFCAILCGLANDKDAKKESYLSRTICSAHRIQSTSSLLRKN
mgnify:CR=1 FL=1